jgi:hypothetical protein
LRRALLALTYRRDYMKNMPHLALVSQWALTSSHSGLHNITRLLTWAILSVDT